MTRTLGLVLATVQVVCVWTGQASSQCFSSIPECAQSCLSNAAEASTSCETTDYRCQCADETWQAVWDGSENCLLASCGNSMTYEKIQAAAEAFCYAVNKGQACSSSSTSGGGTSTTYTSTTTTVLPSISATSGSSTSATSSSTTSATPTGSASGATGTATAATSSSTAGAAVQGPVGSLGMLVLGVLALA